MEFEWDPAKSVENKRKHGVSFEEAVALWDGLRVDVEDLARSDDGEQRSATIGWVGQKLYVAIWTKRGTKIRLISARRARKDEEIVFFEKIQNRP